MFASSALVTATKTSESVDVLLEQQFLVGGVAGQHDRVAQHLGGAARALRVALDQLDLRTPSSACARRMPMLPPPAMTTARRRLELAQLAHHLADVLRAARKNTSSPGSMTVSPSGLTLRPRR
jgi:hypothetical protein